MTIESKATKRKRALFAALAGALLALVCHALPIEYQKPCATVIHICTGGH